MTVVTGRPYIPPVGAVKVHFVDEHLAVVDKPSGLLSVPGRGDDKSDCLMSRLRQMYPDVLNVHRLDMETSGLMVVARHADSQRALSRAFEQRRVSKVYEAVVAGALSQSVGTIDMPLISDWPNRPRQRVDEVNGKPATTSWQVLSAEETSSRVALRPTTGRSHQLRVHMDAIGHPILGDSLYGTSSSRAAAPRLWLHATELAFDHPHTAARVHIISKAPF